MRSLGKTQALRESLEGVSEQKSRGNPGEDEHTGEASSFYFDTDFAKVKICICTESRMWPRMGHPPSLVMALCKESWHPNMLLPLGSKTAETKSTLTHSIYWAWLCWEDLNTPSDLRTVQTHCVLSCLCVSHGYLASSIHSMKFTKGTK